MRSRTAGLPLALCVLAAACGHHGGGAPDAPVSTPDAIRLLDQATFGPSDQALNDVKALGIAGWVDAQLALPPTGYPPLPAVPPSTAAGCPTGSPATCYRDKYTSFPVELQFYKNAISGNDQLRQRVAFAYSQIFVISGHEIRPAFAMREYQQTLLENAFSTYRTLLEKITLHPAMGEYLDMANNDRPNPTRGIAPNENYAREVMQLFSIGTVMLHPDGTAMTDSSGAQIPSYTQDIVEGYASAFTGWTYPPAPGAASRWTNPPYFIGPMVAFEAHHDPASKTLLGGAVLQPNQSTAQDLAGALDSIAAHPNAGPFLGKQLIQFLVTSNPSPAYVARIAAVFNDDGKGVRGNMGAVVRAILLDPDARGDARTEPSFGKLREPALALTGPLRALGGSTDGVWPTAQSVSQGEPIFNAGSVFNFYPPDYQLPGSQTLVAPQFGILNTTTVINRLNQTYALLYQPNGFPADPSVSGSSGTQVNLAALQSSAADPAALVDRLDALALHATLTQAEKAAILTAINAVPATDALGRIRMAAYLILASPRYQIMR